MSKNVRQRELQRIFAAIRSMHQRNRTVANLYGLSRSLAEGHAAVEVAAHPNIRATELANRLGLSPVTTARVLRASFEAGLIRWKSDPNDGRVRRLELTPNGEKLIAQNLERNTATFGAAYERLPANGRRKFQLFLNVFCDGWGAPPAAAAAEEPPLMMEIRRLTRALGLLTDRLSFAPWCTPLKWHVLTLARDCGPDGVSTAVLCTSLAASSKVIEDQLRVLKADRLIRCGRRHGTLIPVFIAEKGRSALNELEAAACAQFDQCLKALRAEELSEFATLWEYYSGKFVTPLVQAITRGTILQCVDDPDAREEARAFIIEQRVKQKLLKNLPATFVGSESVVFVLYRFRNPTAAVELVQVGNREWRAANFLIEPSQISNNTIRQLIPIFLQNALLITTAAKIRFEKDHTSRAVWSQLAGRSSDSQLSISLAG